MNKKEAGKVPHPTVLLSVTKDTEAVRRFPPSENDPCILKALTSPEGSPGPKPECVVLTLLPVLLTKTIPALTVNQDWGKEITTSQFLTIKGCN